MTKPNVLFIVMDTARAQSTLPNEEPGVMTEVPSVLNNAVTFSQAVTTAPWTLPSHASMFTGQYTSNHGTHAGSKHFSPDVDPIAEQVRRIGYRTMAVSNNSWISPEFGFDRGFEEFYKGWELVESNTDLSTIVSNTESRLGQVQEILRKVSVKDMPVTVVNAIYSRYLKDRYDNGALLTNHRIKKYLESIDDEEQFFVFANYIEPHLQYDPPDSWREKYLPDDMEPSQLSRANQAQWEYFAGEIDMDTWEFRALESLYKSEIDYLDYRIAELLKFIDDQGILEETLVVITGDHGENIGEHGLMDHQYSLHDTLLRVPLFVSPPGKSNGSTVNQQVELRDIFATIIDVTDAPSPESDTVSNNSLLSANPGREATFSEYVVPQPSIETLLSISEKNKQDLITYDRSLQCIRTEGWKYIRGSDESEWLFDLRTDPAESENLVEKNEKVVGELSEKIGNSLVGGIFQYTVDDEEIDPATEQRLKKLGYI